MKTKPHLTLNTMVNEQPKISLSGRYSESEAARLLGCNRKTLQRARASKTIRAIKGAGAKSRRVYYHGADLLTFYHRH